MSEEKTKEVWLGLWEKTIRDFLIWLIKETRLNNEQGKNLNKIFEAIKSGTIRNQSILDLLVPILDVGQNLTAQKTYAGLFVKNLEEFYTNTRQKMTFEEMQTADAYAKII